MSREPAIFVLRHCIDIDPPYPTNHDKGYDYVLPDGSEVHLPQIRLSQAGFQKADTIGKVFSKWIKDKTNYYPIGHVITQQPFDKVTTQNPFCTAFSTINPGVLPGHSAPNPNPNPNQHPDPNQPVYPDMAKLPTKVLFFDGISDLKSDMDKDFTGTLFADNQHSTFVTMTRQTMYSPCTHDDTKCDKTKFDPSLFLGTLANESDWGRCVYPSHGKTLYIFSHLNTSTKKFDKLELFNINDDGSITGF
ncbi:MAG: hypothetical protein MI974_34100 [Chitinophagales bacterium]|nr:hypothetical protein [Chitinophagales bacterium]